MTAEMTLDPACVLAFIIVIVSPPTEKHQVACQFILKI